jgi:hypothetical protein
MEQEFEMRIHLKETAESRDNRQTGQGHGKSVKDHVLRQSEIDLSRSMSRQESVLSGEQLSEYGEESFEEEVEEIEEKVPEDHPVKASMVQSDGSAIMMPKIAMPKESQ